MAAGAAARRDPRVRCCSRRGLERVLGLCAPFLRALAAGQPGGIAADDVLWVRRRQRAGGPARRGRAGSGRAAGKGPRGVVSPPRGAFKRHGAKGRGLAG